MPFSGVCVHFDAFYIKTAPVLKQNRHQPSANPATNPATIVAGFVAGFVAGLVIPIVAGFMGDRCASNLRFRSKFRPFSSRLPSNTHANMAFGPIAGSTLLAY